MTDAEVTTAHPGASAAGSWATDVWRSDVLDLYHEAADRRLVLISAPAGYGKSVLATQWCEIDPGRPVVRHTLTGTTADLVVLGRLQRRLCAGPPALAVLDDVHRVTSVAAITQLRHLVDTLPVGCQLMLATREDPEVGLTEWRANDDLFEIRSDRLAMDLDMTTLMLWAANVPMSGSATEDLHRRTEGWAAGLALAARTLRIADRDEPLPSDMVDCEGVMDTYMLDEVLSDQDDEVRRFLLESSAMPSISAALCDAVIDGIDGAETLRTVVRSNLFVVPVVGRPGWYRYHCRFRALLRDELHRSDPGAGRRIEARASAWHEAQMARRAVGRH